MCNLHRCYTFCTGVTLFALVLHLNCTALSQSESSNFFMYIITRFTVLLGIDSLCNVIWKLSLVRRGLLSYLRASKIRVSQASGKKK